MFINTYYIINFEYIVAFEYITNMRIYNFHETFDVSPTGAVTPHHTSGGNPAPV